MSRQEFSAEELAEFKAAQRLAYDATAAIEKELYEGITEKQAARMLEEWLGARGVKRYFHYGFAWFGDRTRFRGFSRPSEGNVLNDLLNPKMAHFGKQFLPTDRALRQGDAVILDVGPIYGRAPSDMGYSCTLGEPSPEFHEARMALEPYRRIVLERVNAGVSQGAIYKELDELIADQGFENIHSYYPGSVLAHKVSRVPGLGLPTFRVKGFSPQALVYLTGEVLEGVLRPKNHAIPIWNDESDRPCEPGLWAVEPHIGKGDIGVKWEELLVVTDEGAHWLDDDLPHVNYWREHGSVSA